MNLDIIVPILSSAGVVTLIEFIKWRYSISMKRQERREARSDSYEDQYITDLRNRLAKLEERVDESEREIGLWKTKYYELRENHKILEVQYEQERSKVELLEWKVKDLEDQLNGGTHIE